MYKGFLPAFLVILISVNSWATLQTTSEFKPNEIIVKYKDGVRRNKAAMEEIYELVSVSKVSRMHGAFRNIEHLVVDEQDISETIAELEKNPLVEYAQPNYILKALPIDAAGLRPLPASSIIEEADGSEYTQQLPCILPGFPKGCKPRGAKKRPEVAEKPAEVSPPVVDPSLTETYGLENIGASKAWAQYKGNQSIVVAVIDTGVDYNHEDLSFNMWRNPNPSKNDLVGWDFVHNDNLPFDDYGHGTHCAGTIGAVGGNGKGVSGVSPRVSIMALKFLGSNGSGDTMSAVKAIDYAVSHGAKILSNSWGGKGDSDNKALQNAIRRAEEKGVLFIAAAGNESANNDENPSYPAGFEEPNLIAVAATDKGDKLASFSNYGKKRVHLAAPGVNVYSTVPNDKYKRFSGTSMACPHVAGAAALVWSANPSFTYKEVKEKLLESVDKLPELGPKTITGGRLNVARALGI